MALIRKYVMGKVFEFNIKIFNPIPTCVQVKPDTYSSSSLAYGIQTHTKHRSYSVLHVAQATQVHWNL